MKLRKILLTLFVTLAFTATVNADGYKLKVCERAETTFWDTVQMPTVVQTNPLLKFLMKKIKWGIIRCH